MKISELFTILTEVHWTDLYPKTFAEFRKKYLKIAREGKMNGFYVQFTNFVDNTLDKNAYQKPDHNDPVGIYGYPIKYVLTHPADIWYGKNAKYLRVLQDISKSSLDLRYIDSYNKVVRFLNSMGFTPTEVDKMVNLSKRYYKERHKGSNKFAKIFLTCVQIDLLSEPIDYHQGGMFSKAAPIYRLRTGAEQTALFRRAKIDALEDTATNNRAAIISDREPEQIIFLTRGAFKVVDVYALRPNEKNSYLASPEVHERSRRKLASELAKIMNDRIIESAKEPATYKRVNFDASYRYFWTAKGRRIDINFDRSDSYYIGKRMGEKKHKEDKLSISYITKIKVDTEIGSLRREYGSSETFIEIENDFRRMWKELLENPQKTDWIPQNAQSFMDAVNAEKMEYYRQEREKKIEKRKHYGQKF